MAEMTRRQLKLQKRREEWAKEQKAREFINTEKKIAEAKFNALYYIGIPNGLALMELYNLLDEYEEMEYKRPTIEKFFPELKTHITRLELATKRQFGGNKDKEAVFQDVCNAAYGEIEEPLNKLKQATINRLKDLKIKIPEFRAQFINAMTLMMVADGMYDSVLNYTLISTGIDLRRSFEDLSIENLSKVLTDMSKVVMKITELKKSDNADLDMLHCKEWVEAKDELINTIGQPNFINEQCKKAAVLNKERMPNLYNRMLKDVEDGKL